MIGVRVKLTFPEELVREPVIARMVTELHIVPNIRKADVGEHGGWIICELDGDGDRRPGPRLAPGRGRPGRPARRHRRELTGQGRSGGAATARGHPRRPAAAWRGHRVQAAAQAVGSSGFRMVQPAPETLRGS